MIAFIAQTAETATETAESFHMTFGEMVLTAATLLLALVTVALFVVSARLVKVTALAANAEMAKVSMNANDDMRDVAAAAIAPTPKPPTYATPATRHHHTVYSETPKLIKR